MASMWSDSIALMLLGMGTVYVFLILLIFGVTIMSSLLGRFSTPEPITKPSPALGSSSADADIAVVAAAAFAAAKASKQS